jgi:hypothetical protein
MNPDLRLVQETRTPTLANPLVFDGFSFGSCLLRDPAPTQTEPKRRKTGMTQWRSDERANHEDVGEEAFPLYRTVSWVLSKVSILSTPAGTWGQKS